MPPTPPTSRPRLEGGLLAIAGLALLLYALWPWLPVPGRTARPRTVVFYGFSILCEALNADVPPQVAGRRAGAPPGAAGPGARRRPGQESEAGFEALRGGWRHVVAQAASARAARTQFENGFGDVLVTYEQDVLGDSVKGKLPGEIVYPPSTVLSEHTLVVIDRKIPA